MCGPTTDRREIRAWAEAHDAVPAEVHRYVFNSEPAVLRFLFGDAKQGTPELRPISWDAFFATFEMMSLVFLYEPEQPNYVLLLSDAKTAFGAEIRPN